MARTAPRAAPCSMPSVSRRRISPKPQIGIASTWSEVTPVQRPHRQARPRVLQRRERRRRQGHHLQHHHHLGRHLDGHRGHEILARFPRGDRRFDRNRGRLRGHGRLRRHRRLRQEHARLPDGHGPHEPPGGVRLWRHHSSRLRHDQGRAKGPRHRFRVRSRRQTRQRRILRRGTGNRRVLRHSRRRRLRRHVHRQHHGQRDRGARHVAAEQLRPGRHLGRQDARLLRRRRRRGQPHQARHQAARHPDQGGVRKRHHRAHRARRLHQRRAAHPGHGLVGGHRYHHRRLRTHRQKRARARRPETVRQIRHGRPRENRRHRAADEDAARCRPAARRLHDRDRPHDAREPRKTRQTLSGRPADHPPGFTIRSKRTATCASSTAISPKAARSRKSPARKARSSPARPACSTPRTLA